MKITSASNKISQNSYLRKEWKSKELEPKIVFSGDDILFIQICNIQYPISNIQYTTYNIQHTTHNLQPTTYNIQYTKKTIYKIQ